MAEAYLQMLDRETEKNPIVIDSDDEEVVLISSTVKPKTPLFPNGEADDSVVFITSKPSPKKRPLSTDDLDIENLSVIEAHSSPTSISTHNEVSPVIIEQRKKDMAALQEEYGDEENGFGFKQHTMNIGGEEVAVAFTLCVIPCVSSESESDGFEFFEVRNGTDEIQPQPGRRLKSFPPVRMRVEFLSASSTDVHFSLHCTWLLKDHIKRLIVEMQRHLDKHNGSVVPVVKWMESRSVKFLKILHHRRLYYTADNHPENKDYYIIFADTEMVYRLFRDHADRVDSMLGTQLVLRQAFDCDICFEHKPAMAAFCFPECKHIYCMTCVSQDFTIKINEGQVNDLNCLVKDCKSKADILMIRKVVDNKTFQRYCDLTTEVFVDTSTTMIRCPLPKCGVPMELFPNHPRELECYACRFRFCGTCKNKEHPNEPCLTDDQKRQIREEWKAADEHKKEILKKKYGADNIKFALDDAESQEWISKNSKLCPACTTPIQKTAGCNKMQCTSKGCGTFFCWLCLSILDRTNPYAHFNVGSGNACANMLHTGPAAQPQAFNHFPGLLQGIALRAAQPAPVRNPVDLARHAQQRAHRRARIRVAAANANVAMQQQIAMPRHRRGHGHGMQDGPLIADPPGMFNALPALPHAAVMPNPAQNDFANFQRADAVMNMLRNQNMVLPPAPAYRQPVQMLPHYVGPAPLPAHGNLHFFANVFPNPLNNIP